MKQNLLLLSAIGALLVGGCAETTRTIEAKDGKMLMTEQRGTGSPKTNWELKDVSSSVEADSLHRAGWKREGIIHHPGGPDTFLMKRKLGPMATSVRLPFRPMLVTSFGTNTTSDGTYRIGVGESSLDLAHLSGTHGEGEVSPLSSWSSSISPQGWKAQTGWFVFVENQSNIWAYDGDRKLILNVETVKGNDLKGTLYVGNYPCAVPVEVFSRLSEAAKKDVPKRD